MKRKAFRTLTVVSAGLAATIACGGGGYGGAPSAPSAPSTPGSASGATIRITASGVTPKQVKIEMGSQVTFVNEDTRAHEMMSDPHPTHSACPEINQVGNLSPGQSRQTGAFMQSKNCGFHDNRQDGAAELRGNIIVGEGGEPGGYY